MFLLNKYASEVFSVGESGHVCTVLLNVITAYNNTVFDSVLFASLAVKFSSFIYND